MSDFEYLIKYPDNRIEKVPYSKVVYEMYNKLAVIPSLAELKKYKSCPEDATCSTSSNKYDQKYIDTFKKNISEFEEVIPMFDINTKNVYIITFENLQYRVLTYNYRVPNDMSIKLLKSTLKHYEEKPKTDFTTLYIEKLTKNIRFLDCYDLTTLHNTYYKLYYKSIESNRNITSCIKASYFPFMKNVKPYYDLDEMKMTLLNSGYNEEQFIKMKIEDMCEIINNNTISSKLLLLNHIYIKENIGMNYIRLYTLIGSFYFNTYLRQAHTKDVFLEKQIYNIWCLINKAPAFDKKYYVYRFIKNDDYLSKLRIGDIYEEYSFTSTTRNAFYNYEDNIFGFILLKIHLPPKKEGIALCLETYSLFQKEEEILLAPGKFKLIGINDFPYHHTKTVAKEMIIKQYEFEYIDSLKVSPLEYTKKYKEPSSEIPFLNFKEIHLRGTLKDKIDSFINQQVYSLNYQRYFYAKLGKEVLLFQVYKVNNNPVYDKYFMLQKKYKKDGIYLIHQNEDSGTIKLIIEINQEISVNFLYKFIGSNAYYKDIELIDFLADLANTFEIDKVFIHDNYISYENLAIKNLQDYNIYDINILDFDNPDTHIINLYSGYFKNYPEEFINYLLSKANFFERKKYIPKFNEINGVQYGIPKKLMDLILNLKSDEIFYEHERSNITRIYDKNKAKSELLGDFYLLVHFKYFYLLTELNKLILSYLFNKELLSPKDINNPLSTSYFTFYPYIYLYGVSKEELVSDGIDKYAETILLDPNVRVRVKR